MPGSSNTTYAARQPPPEKREDPVTVLVTGFGPFLEKYPRNSSWEIASTLPALLLPTPSHPTPIHIHVHHEHIRVAYNTVLDLAPKFLPSSSSSSSDHSTPLPSAPDITLHIGLAASRSFYTLEHGAHRNGYAAIPDVDGLVFTDEDAEIQFPSSRFPAALKTGFEVADVVRRWTENLGVGDGDGWKRRGSGAECVPDVRLSKDAGNFMCGFVYWNSLAGCWERRRKRDSHTNSNTEINGSTRRPVAFLHVPDLSSTPEKLEEGRRVAVSLIRALVESRREVGVEWNETGKASHLGRHEGGDAPRTDANFA